MLRNLLLLLEATPSGSVAREVACRIAARGNCNLTALEIHEPEIRIDRDRRLRSIHKELLEQIQQQCQAEGKEIAPGGDGDFLALQTGEKIYCRGKILSGLKYSLLSREAECNDLAVIGRDGNFVEQLTRDAKEIINLMLDYQPRPIIITPPDLQMETDILITHDGSSVSARAIQFFVLMGLASHQNVHILSIDRNRNVARARVEAVGAYLQNHKIKATHYAVDSGDDPRDIILDTIRETNSSLVVAGASGVSKWRRSLFGSVSEYLIRYCPVPLFSCP